MSDSNNDNGGSDAGFFGHCFRSCFGGKRSSSSPSEPTQEHVVESKASSEQAPSSVTARPEPGPAQTPYEPRHAKKSHIQTTSTPQIKKANEIL